MVKYLFLNEVPEKLRESLANNFSNLDRDTFLIRGLPPELTGGALARYSRALTGIRLTVANEFLDEQGQPSQERGSELMDRVLNAFGDDSVGELEGVHVGFENASNLLTKIVEDRRIGGSPIEQSTRYVKYDIKDENGRWRYLRPKEIIEVGLGEDYEKAMDTAFEVYSLAILKLSDYFKQQFPKDNFTIEVNRGDKRVPLKENELVNDEERREFKNAYNFTIRCAALDVGRCVLPVSTLTHFGVFGNGRYFTNLITTLKSHELAEAQERGYELERELNQCIPTFIKRNRINKNLKKINDDMREVTKRLFYDIDPTAEKVSLIEGADYWNLLLASSLFPYTNISLPQILDKLKELSLDQKREIAEKYKGTRENRKDRTGRGLEAGYPLTFDLVLTFAEYRDLQRHRMLTQQRQRATIELGFVSPAEIKEVQLEESVNKVVEQMEGLHLKLKKAGLEATVEYATLFNHRVRLLFGMNLREFQHLAELRTQPSGHFGYRSLVMEMTKQVVAKYPEAETFLEFVNFSDPGNKIARAKEQSRIAGKNLAKGIRGDLE